MAAGDNAFWSDIATAISQPACKLTQQTAQSVASGAEAALTFGPGSEDEDPNNMHDTAVNTSRITPTVSGLYVFHSVVCAAARADYNNLGLAFSKNGAVTYPRARIGPNAFSASKTVELTAMLRVNGSTDFVEALYTQTNTAAAAALTVVGSSFNTIFECWRIRP